LILLEQSAGSRADVVRRSARLELALETHKKRNIEIAVSAGDELRQNPERSLELWRAYLVAWFRHYLPASA
jgi:hypothetical protein